MLFERSLDMNTHLTYSVLLTLLLTMIVTAQDSGGKSDPIDLTVLDHSWRKELSSQQVSSNPRRPPNEDRIGQTPLERDMLRQRAREFPNQTMQTPVPTSPSTPGGGRDFYVYKITVKNNGAKLIKEVDWEFRFLHPDTQQELANVRVSSKVNLSPGKTKVIKSRTVQQPIGVADQLDKKYRVQFMEEVVIHRIVYSDGSAWQRQP
jgi:hypothetical protein